MRGEETLVRDEETKVRGEEIKVRCESIMRSATLGVVCTRETGVCPYNLWDNINAIINIKCSAS